MEQLADCVVFVGCMNAVAEVHLDKSSGDIVRIADNLCGGLICDRLKATSGVVMLVKPVIELVQT